MKISFVTPQFDNTKHGKGSSAKINYGNFPPLGILYMMAELRINGHECQLIDANSIAMTEDQIVQEIREFGADLIGVSTMTPSAPFAYALIRYLKTRLDTPIVLGGVHCNAQKERPLYEVPQLDMVVIGEAERTIVSLADAMEGRIPFEDVRGLCFRNSQDEITVNKPAELIMDLDELTFPAREILDHSLYRPLPLSFKALPMTSMITSRGCPYGACSFCFEAGNHAFKFRRHSPEYVIEEIKKTIIPAGIKEVLFWDDIFLINKNWIAKFSELMKPLGLHWSCYGWPKYVNEEMLRQVADAGCWAVFYGFESGDQKLLDVIDKKMTLEDSRKAAEWTHKAGMATRASFMLALPGETPELAKKTIDFAIELDCTMAQFHPTFPESGTKLFDLASRDGQILPAFEGRMKAAYVPDGYKDTEEVERIVKTAYRRFYFRPRFILKHLLRIRSWTDIVHYYHGFRFILGLFYKERTPLKQVCHVEALPASENTAAR